MPTLPISAALQGKEAAIGPGFVPEVEENVLSRSPARFLLASVAVAAAIWLGHGSLIGAGTAQTAGVAAPQPSAAGTSPAAAKPTAATAANTATASRIPGPQAALADRSVLEANNSDAADRLVVSKSESTTNNTPKASAPPRLQISPLAENSAPEGCGCFFYRPTDKRELGPLLLHMDEKGAATVKPEGKLVTLRLIDEQHSRRDPTTISAKDRVLMKLRGGETNASITGMAERNCPRSSNGTSCASVSYQTLLNIDHQGKRSSMPAWGFCGCR